MSTTSRGSYSLNPLTAHYVAAVAIAVTLIAGFLRHFLLGWSDPLHCRALMDEGQWLDSEFTNWQPEGCMLHSYRSQDVSQCLASRRVLFIGDSIARQLFFATASTADPSLPVKPPNDDKKHSDHILTSKAGTEFTFIWDPYLNATRTTNLLRGQDDTSYSVNATVRTPAMLIINSGLWYLRYAESSGGLAKWESTVESTIDTIRHAGASLADTVIFMPVEDVAIAKLSNERALTIHHSDIDAMNSDLLHRLDPPSTAFFALPPNPFKKESTVHPISFPLAFNRMLDDSLTDDGMHYSNAVLKAQANVLLNYRCNEALPKKFPLDKTCCRAYPTPNIYQILIIVILASWGPIARYAAGPLAQSPRLRSLFPSEEHIMPLSVYGLAILFIFIADRTPIWLKEQKQYNPYVVAGWFLASLAAGLATVKNADKDLGFLNREQTDEWKGWMQIAILIYHYFGASKISGIYNPIRILVAAYLFMTGFGHTTFYLKKADFGVLRVAQVLVRLNILPITLAYTMNTDYISYYFSPLVSMWYLIIYVTMWAGKGYNDRITFLTIKLILSMGAVTLFMGQPWLMQELFVWLERLCGIHWPAKEWAFRVNLDLWIVYFGMFSAIGFIKFRELRLNDHRHWPLLRRSTLIASGFILVWFFAFELSQPSKFTYNAWNPYISFLPIFAFMFLRNGNMLLRSASSRLFAFIGTCSLETFIIQFHFWLAADTKGILLVIPGTKWRPLNIILSTVMFIWLSHKVADASGTLTNWFCASEKKTLPNPATLNSQVRSTPASTEAPEPEVPLLSVDKTNGLDDQAPDSHRPETADRWVDRLANDSQRPSSQRGFRVFVGREDSIWAGLKPVGLWRRLLITGILLWILNIIWPY